MIVKKEITVPEKDIKQWCFSIFEGDIPEGEHALAYMSEALSKHLLNEDFIGIDDTLRFSEHYDIRMGDRVCNATITAVPGRYFR